MTKKLRKELLKTLTDIKPLPKLKKGFTYRLNNNGGIDIYGRYFMVKKLFHNLSDFMEGRYIDLEIYTQWFDKPIYKEKITKEIVGYE